MKVVCDNWLSVSSFSFESRRFSFFITSVGIYHFGFSVLLPTHLSKILGDLWTQTWTSF